MGKQRAQVYLSEQGNLPPYSLYSGDALTCEVTIILQGFPQPQGNAPQNHPNPFECDK